MVARVQGLRECHDDIGRLLERIGVALRAQQRLDARHEFLGIEWLHEEIGHAVRERASSFSSRLASPVIMTTGTSRVAVSERIERNTS